MMGRGLFWVGVLSLLVGSAQAKTAKMVWTLQPNVLVSRSVSAISANLSANCRTNIPNGQLILKVNDQTLTLTPQNNTGALPQINGKAAENNKYTYNYSILWRVANPQFSIYSLACLGDNHRSD